MIAALVHKFSHTTTAFSPTFSTNIQQYCMTKGIFLHTQVTSHTAFQKVKSKAQTDCERVAYHSAQAKYVCKNKQNQTTMKANQKPAYISKFNAFQGLWRNYFTKL